MTSDGAGRCMSAWMPWPGRSAGRHGVAAGAAGPDVGPVGLDVVQAGLPAGLAVHDLPAGRDGHGGRPQRVLLLVVDEYHERAVGVIKGVHAAEAKRGPSHGGAPASRDKTPWWGAHRFGVQARRGMPGWPGLPPGPVTGWPVQRYRR